MMSYSDFLMLLILPIVGSALWMALVKEETEVFSRRLYKYALSVFLFGALLGAATILKRQPFMLPSQVIFIVSYLLMFILGVWHTASLYNRHAWVWDHNQSFRLALPFTLFAISCAALGYFIFFWMTEEPVFKSRAGLADRYTLGFITALLPVAVLWGHREWNKIPVVTKELQPWMPDLDKAPAPLEPDSKALPLSIHIPMTHLSNDIITFDIRAPLDNTFEQIFYHLLYKHNVVQNPVRKIEIAKDNKKSKVYGWTFFTARKKWWGIKKTYLNPLDKIEYLPLQRGQKVFAERMKIW